MGILTFIPIETDPAACLDYISDSTKSIPQKDTMRLITYMQSHAAETACSVGYNGCSGIKDLAIQQFRACETLYNSQHLHRGQSESVVTVTPKQYLRMCGNIAELPKGITPDDDGLIRVKKKGVLAQHFILSLDDGEKASPELLHKIWQEMMELPELRNFYCFGNVHVNTDNVHLHAVVSNFSKDGTRKLAMKNDLLYHLKNEVDHICAKYGLSVIDDAKLAYKYPEREQWIEDLVQQGTVKVLLPANADHVKNPTPHQRRMLKLYKVGKVGMCKGEAYEGKFKTPAKNKKQMGIQAAREDKLNQRLRPDANPQVEEINAVYKRSEDKKLYFGAPFILRKGVDSKIYHRLSAAGRYEKIYYAVPMYQNRRLKSRIEMEFELGAVVIRDFPQYQPAWHLNSLMDTLTLCRKLNVHSPADLDRRLKDIGEEIGRTDRFIAYQKKTIEKGQALFDAIQVWKDPDADETAKNAAYSVMAAHKCTTPSQIDDFLQRRHAALERLPSLEGKRVSLADLDEKRKELSRQYKSVKHALESIRLEQAKQEIQSFRFAQEMKARFNAKEQGLDSVLNSIIAQRPSSQTNNMEKNEREG